MKIAAFPKAYLDQMSVDRTMTVFDWIEQARALPVDGLEMYSGFFWDTSAAAVERVGAALDAAGFEMPMLCASPDFTHPDPDVRQREFDTEVRMIEITRVLAGPGGSCRVLTGQAHPGVAVEQGLAWAVDAIERLIPIAAQHEVVLAIENHYKDGAWTYPEFAQRPELFLQVLDRIDERVWFGVQYDPSNALVAGADSADFLAQVVDRVVTMQASDRYLAGGTTLDDLRTADGTLGYSPDLRHGVIGKGLNDYDRIFTLLTEAGYDGWISIEDGVNGLDEMRQSAEFLQQARQRWFGGSTAVRVRTRDAAIAAARRG